MKHRSRKLQKHIWPIYWLTGFFSMAMTAAGLEQAIALPEAMFLSKTLIAWLLAVMIQLPITLTYLHYADQDQRGDNDET